MLRALALLGLLGVGLAGTAPANLLQLAQADPAAAYAAWALQAGKGPQQAAGPAFEAFRANAAFIASYNQRHAASHQLELNEFADLTWEAFARTRLGFDAAAHAASRANRSLAAPRFRYAGVDPPPAVDWREKGVVSPVKNQGACGSCWAFSATGAVEGVNAIRTGELLVLSEQELVDCDTSTGNAGCGGGLMDYAFEYIKKNGGIDTEEDWGYYSGWGFGTWCNQRKLHDRHVVTIDGYEDVPKDDEAALRQAASQQPVAVGICASPAMQFYKGGVIDTCCDDLNHGVLLVGYGHDEATNAPYWLVKNSWGGSWGDSGYFKLRAGAGGKGGLCGILTAASYPVKNHDNPRVPEVCDPFAWAECPWGSSCSCAWRFSFFGLFSFCVRHDCCPLRRGVGCPDNAHCCPHDAPVCDTDQGVCRSEDGTKTLPWTSKNPADYDAAAAGPIPADDDSPTARLYRRIQRLQRAAGARWQQQQQQQEQQQQQQQEQQQERIAVV